MALHREFARLYERDLSPQAQPRMARHLRSAGMMAPAARAYINAARDAIDAYTFHDALQFCSDGEDCLEHVPPSRSLQLLRAQLKVLVTEAALQTGAFDLASRAAGDAARAARAADDSEAIAMALVSRAALGSILGGAAQWLTDAREALQLSATNTNTVVAARAGVQMSAFARAAGRFGDAATFAKAAGARAAVATDRALEYAGIEQLVRALISWWRFADAEQEILRARPIAEAAGVSAQARLHCLSAWLYCTMERFDAANRALTEAKFFSRDLAERRDSVAPDSACPLILVRFTVHFLEGLVALAQDRYADALDAVDRCLGVTPLASLAPYRDAAAKLELSARMKAHEELRREFPVPTEGLPTPLLFTIDSAPLWRACVRVRQSTEPVRAALRAGLDDLEERANAIPLDCDRAFALLGSAASVGGEPIIAARAKARVEHYHAARMAAAAAHRSIRPRVSSGSMSRPST